MRVEIADENCRVHVIDSQDLELIGRWFVEKAKLLMSANCTTAERRMWIWPSNLEETKLIPQYHRDIRITQDNLLSFAGSILEASQLMADAESGSDLVMVCND